MAIVCTTTFAQPPQGRGGFGQRGQGGFGKGGFGQGGGPGGQFGPPGGQMPPSPFVVELDTNQDQALSLAELKQAPKLLKTLDQNKDGKLTEDELRPQPPGQDARSGGRRGRPQAGGPREFGNLSERGERPEGEVQEDGRRGRPNRGGDSAMSIHPERMQEHAMEFDADKDGKLSVSELQAFIADFAKVHGGEQAGRPGRGENSQRRRPTGDGDASERPSRPSR